MKLEFDFRAKIIILFLDMCLVAILKSNIIIYSMLFILTIYLIIQGYLKSAINLFLINTFYGAGNYNIVTRYVFIYDY